MTKKVKCSLVQGDVSFTINCNELIGLVPKEIADNPHRLKDWLEDKAFKMVESAAADVDIAYVEDVNISEETADKYANEVISSSEWSKIVKESKQ